MWWQNMFDSLCAWSLFAATAPDVNTVAKPLWIKKKQQTFAVAPNIAVKTFWTGTKVLPPHLNEEFVGSASSNHGDTHKMMLLRLWQNVPDAIKCIYQFQALILKVKPFVLWWNVANSRFDMRPGFLWAFAGTVSQKVSRHHLLS